MKVSIDITAKDFAAMSTVSVKGTAEVGRFKRDLELVEGSLSRSAGKSLHWLEEGYVSPLLAKAYLKAAGKKWALYFDAGRNVYVVATD